MRKQVLLILGIGITSVAAALLAAELFLNPIRIPWFFLALQGCLILNVILALLFRRGGGGEALAHVVSIPIRLVLPNPYQPRQAPEPQSLEGLVRSIQQYGLIVPIIVRRRGRKYELVAGQRRLMACKMAGRGKVPAVVRELSDQEVLEVGLLENLQRAPLTVVEQAEIFHRLAREFDSLTPQELANRMGLDAGWVQRHEKFLTLSPVVKQAILMGLITPLHAEILSTASAGDQVLLLKRVHDENLSPEALRQIAQPQ